MAYVPKLYLETTMFNFYFSDQDPPKKADTKGRFRRIKERIYEPYTSRAVIQELIVLTDIVNLCEGYKQIGIFSPTEIIENGKNQ